MLQLAKVEATWRSKEGRELVQLSSLDLMRSAEPLSRDLETVLIGGYLADHMLEFAQENDESQRLYRLLDSSVQALLDGLDVALVSRYFEVWVLRLSGIFPVPVECPLCEGSLLDNGAALPHGDVALVCRQCHPGSDDEILSPEVIEMLIRSRFESLEQMASNAPGTSAVAGVEAVCRMIRRAFLQRELKSYRVMQQALAG